VFGGTEIRLLVPTPRCVPFNKSRPWPLVIQISKCAGRSLASVRRQSCPLVHWTRVVTWTGGKDIDVSFAQKSSICDINLSISLSSYKFKFSIIKCHHRDSEATHCQSRSRARNHVRWRLAYCRVTTVAESTAAACVICPVTMAMASVTPIARHAGSAGL